LLVLLPFLYCLAIYCLQLIEKLYRARWTKLDGLGALVLTPTRELALQIFEELVKVGFYRPSSRV
jgi:ATP-dependent RNA helicase DDX10/DBP4